MVYRFLVKELQDTPPSGSESFVVLSSIIATATAIQKTFGKFRPAFGKRVRHEANVEGMIATLPLTCGCIILLLDGTV